MNILQINSSARSTGSESTRLADNIVAKLQAADPGATLIRRDLAANPHRLLDEPALARAGVTFKYGATGPVGLLTGKKVYVAVARGGMHKDTANDAQLAHLKAFLGFVGLTDVRFFYAEGMSMGPDAVAKAQAQADADINAVLV